jgi:hypothetical protein
MILGRITRGPHTSTRVPGIAAPGLLGYLNHPAIVQGTSLRTFGIPHSLFVVNEFHAAGLPYTTTFETVAGSSS